MHFCSASSRALVLLGLLVGCTDGPEPGTRGAPQYLGIQTQLLDEELVNFLVEMRGASSAEDVEDYARCAAAQYALIRGFGFARHVRTRVDVEGSLWRADAIYTVSAALPDGAQVIDGEVTVAACAERGIPTV